MNSNLNFPQAKNVIHDDRPYKDVNYRVPQGSSYFGLAQQIEPYTIEIIKNKFGDAKRSSHKNVGIAVLSLVVLILILTLALVGIMLHGAPSTENSVADQNLDRNTNDSVLGEFTGPSVNSSNRFNFENEYFKLNIPNGWNYANSPDGHMRLTKDNYILYINPNFRGSKSDRSVGFYEIASGSPSADAVIMSNISSPCGNLESTSIDLENRRFDLYIDSSNTDSNCKKPSFGGAVWYFSYVSGENRFFNNYGRDRNFLITMSYNSRDVEKLPKKGDTKLGAMLDEMFNIVKSMEIKTNYVEF